MRINMLNPTCIKHANITRTQRSWTQTEIGKTKACQELKKMQSRCNENWNCDGNKKCKTPYANDPPKTPQPPEHTTFQFWKHEMHQNHCQPTNQYQCLTSIPWDHEHQHTRQSRKITITSSVALKKPSFADTIWEKASRIKSQCHLQQQIARDHTCNWIGSKLTTATTTTATTSSKSGLHVANQPREAEVAKAEASPRDWTWLQPAWPSQASQHKQPQQQHLKTGN